MAAIVWSDVEAHAPDLSAVAPGAQADILARVNSALAVDEFDGEEGSKTKLGRIYMAAHLATLAALAASGASGAVKIEEVGDLKREYGVSSAGVGASDYQSTGWGRLYLGLVRTNGGARAGLVI